MYPAFTENLGWDTVELLAWEDAQKIPCQIEGFEDRAVLIWPLLNKLALKLVQELECSLDVFTALAPSL